MGLSPGWLGLLVAGFGLAVAAKAAALWGGAQVGVYALTPVAQMSGTSALLAVAGVLALTFFPSVAEDIVTRGFLMRAFPRLSRRWLFVVVSAAVYVLNHIYRIGNGVTEWVMLFCFGLAYGAALYYSRSLWPAIGLHWGWNFAGQYVDRVASVEVLAPASSPFVSAGAHLGMLAVVVLAGWMSGRSPRGAELQY